MRAAALLAWRNLSSRPARTLLAAAGVVLGVALVMAVSVTVRSMGQGGTGIVTGAGTPSAVLVEPDGDGNRLPQSLADQIKAIPGVDQVLPQITGGGLGLAINGELYGLPFFAIDAATEAELGTYRLLSGKLAGEGVVLEAKWAQQHGLQVGDLVSVLITPQRRYEWPVTGLIAQQGLGDVNGGAVALLSLEPYQAAAGRPAELSRLLVTLTPGAAEEEVARQLNAVLPAGVVALESADASGGAGSMEVEMGLIFFAGMASVVGAFLVFSAFSLSMRQRVAQTGMTLALGATSGQMVASLLLEAAGVGAAGGLLGIPVGLGLARSMLHLVPGPTTRLGTDLAIAPGDFLLSLGVGAGVALVSSVLPAWRASRVSPVEAIRASGATEGRPRYWTALLGLAMAVVGLVSWQWAMQFRGVMIAQAFTLLYYVGASLAIPLLVRWGVQYVLYPIARSLGAVPLLAAANLVRNIDRATLTVSAMMVAVAMLVSFSAISTSFEEGAQTFIRSTMQSDLVLQGDLHPELAARVRRDPDVIALATEGSTWLRAEAGWGLQTLAIEPNEARQVLPFALAEGAREEALTALEEGGGIILSLTMARKHQIQLGDTVRFQQMDDMGEEIAGTFAELRVVGLIVANTNKGRIAYIAQRDANRYFGGAIPTWGYVRLADGVSAGGAAARLQAGAPGIRIQDFQAVEERLLDQVTAEMDAFRAILYIALIASSLGIINTLAMSIVEQRRELALLRAVGGTSGQVTSMVIAESLFLGAVGAGLGVLAGSLFAAGFVAGANGFMDYVAPFVYPVWETITAGLLSLLLAVLAAAVPAWSAGRGPVVPGLRTE